MDSEVNEKLIRTLSSLIYEVRRLRVSKSKDLEVEEEKKYQLQRIADELNAIRFTLEDMNEKQ